tara:strand:+ start:233 stop:403 length:171 start_codon:yes stop_codon:yes gene_type:complete
MTEEETFGFDEVTEDVTPDIEIPDIDLEDNKDTLRLPTLVSDLSVSDKRKFHIKLR